jgi:hypothetical protein
MCAVPTSVISCRAVCTTLTLESHSALGSARAGAAASAVDADAARRVESGAVARRPDSPPTAHLRLSSGCGELLGRAVLRGAAGCGARRQATAAGSSSSSSRVRDASVHMLALQALQGVLSGDRRVPLYVPKNKKKKKKPTRRAMERCEARAPRDGARRPWRLTGRQLRHIVRRAGQARAAGDRAVQLHGVVVLLRQPRRRRHGCWQQRRSSSAVADDAPIRRHRPSPSS